MTSDSRARWQSVLVVAAAIVGLLAMHGFESALIHDGHAGPDGHVRTSAPSAAESHVLSGLCSLDAPSPASIPVPLICSTGSLLDDRIGEASVEAIVPRRANRAILTAFSVLRL